MKTLTSHEIALRFAEKFQREYPNTPIYQLTEELRVSIDEYVQQKVKSVDLDDVGNWKPDETLELLSEIVEKIKLANEEFENGIYDPMLECAKHIHNNYKIVRR